MSTSKGSMSTESIILMVVLALCVIIILFWSDFLPRIPEFFGDFLTQTVQGGLT